MTGRKYPIKKPFQYRKNLQPWLSSSVWENCPTLSVSNRVWDDYSKRVDSYNVSADQNSKKLPISKRHTGNPRNSNNTNYSSLQQNVQENVRSAWINRFPTTEVSSGLDNSQGEQSNLN